MLINEQRLISPSRTRRFWLSDYIFQKRHSEGRVEGGGGSRLGIARRMPRVNKSHQRQFDDTLKMLTKRGQPDPIIINFEQNFRINQKVTTKAFHTARYQSSMSSRQMEQKKDLNKFKKLSGDLIERIKTETERKLISRTPKPSPRNNNQREIAAFKIKASDEWMHGQQQILKINLKQEHTRLKKGRIKKIRLGIDNRSVQQLINELKN